MAVLIAGTVKMVGTAVMARLVGVVGMLGVVLCRRWMVCVQGE